jgi:segregation and condensation protein A
MVLSSEATGIPGRYEVKLPVFEGPLDLLLHLIEKEELDITTVSLAQITDQYLDYISQLEERRAANLVDFLVVASKLLLIKSRLLLPIPRAAVEEDEDDVGEDLVRQLIEYRRFKQVAAFLAERGKQNLRAYVRVGPAAVSGSARSVDMDNTTLSALVQIVRRALEITPLEPPVSLMVPPVTVSIHDKIYQIRNRLKEQGEMAFDVLIAGAEGRVEVIVTFLAVLELVKNGAISIHQEQLFGHILLRYRPEGQKPIEEAVEPGMDEGS